MKKILISLLSIFSFQSLFSQTPPNTMANCGDVQFDRKVNKLLNYTVDVISVQDLHENQDSYLILDTREREEYATSHIPGARFFGYDNPQYDILTEVEKDTEIVVYCSVGYRSEKIGEKLKKKGFTNVKNLYGSIFEWANQGYALRNPKIDSVMEVHTYNKKWSRWLINPEYSKVW